MRVGLVTRKQILFVDVDSTTYSGRWAISEMFRCMKHNCNWPDPRRLGAVTAFKRPDTRASKDYSSKYINKGKLQNENY